MKTAQTRFSIFCLAILAASCSLVLYSPVGQNVPLFREKGEALISAGIGSSDTQLFTLLGESNYADDPYVQAAFAFDSSLAVMSNYYKMHDREEVDAEVKGHGSQFEIAIGKFWPIENSKWVGEVYLGAGTTSIKNQVNGDALNVKYLKTFVQPSIGYRGRIFEFAFTTKIGVVNYTHFTNQLSDQAQFTTAESFYKRNKSVIVFEPGFTYRIGWKNIKFQVQTCATTFSHSGWEGYETVNQLYGGFGLFLRMPAKRNYNGNSATQR